MDFLSINAVVGQSGGPTSAINSSLFGIIKASLENEKIATLYGMKNGIEGFLREEFLDLSRIFSDKVKLSLLQNTPSSILGSCRMRLPKADESAVIYEKILKILKKYNIKYFFYIGGNDSMDTVSKLSEYIKSQPYDVKIIGIPKTIDNDLMCTDHAPGFGSAAKYVATVTSEILRDVSVYAKKSVTLIELMGRDTGWLASASALPGALNGNGVDLIYLPEREFSKKQFICDLEKSFLKHPNLVVAVSEGIRYSNGKYVASSGERDNFGHENLFGVAGVLSEIVKKEIGCKSRPVELSLPQRCSAHLLSDTDIKESASAGEYAVSLATSGATGKMVALERAKGKYKISFKPVHAAAVANAVKYVPSEYISKQGNHVTDACIEYLKPLIRGERKIKYRDGLPVHLILDY